MEIIIIAGCLVAWFGCGLLGGYINEKKGCNYWAGFWCGFLLGILGLIIVIVQKDKNENINQNAIINNNSNADELKKYKELLDSGIITQEEFEKKKQQLLGI